jgi:hypothetical protein
MFSVHCETCDTTHLYGPRRITAMANTDAGIVLTFRCFCGGEATLVTGRAATSPAPAGKPAPVPVETSPAPATAGADDRRELVGCGSNAAA